MQDLYASLEGGMSYNPHVMGQPHPAWEDKGFWIYETPNVARLPKCRILYEIIPEPKVVNLWSARFP